MRFAQAVASRHPDSLLWRLSHLFGYSDTRPDGLRWRPSHLFPWTSEALVALMRPQTQQTKEAVEEIQGESLANSKISVLVRTEYIHQGSFQEEFAAELNLYPPEVNLDRFNSWLVQAPPMEVPNLGEVVAAGPLANELMKRPHGEGLVEALLSYGLSAERARHYEHEVRTGHYLVLITKEARLPV